MSEGASPALTLVKPQDFVYLDEFIAGIHIDLAYAKEDNFIGEPIPGYIQPRGILSLQAAQALKRAHDELQTYDMALKIFDAYRPQQAVNHFISWAENTADTRMKNKFYPRVEKADLFKEGYLARRSSHSRASTVDLTIVSHLEGMAQELDMGTIFDFFGRESSPDYLEISPFQRANRMLLRTFMGKHGFDPHPMEWWHYTLKNEPYPDTYFDFPVL